MDISRKSQEQVAGDNSIQNQVVGTQNNNYVTINGISVTDVATFTTTVSTQVTQQALSLCTQVAYDIACKKMNEFESVWLPRVEKMENAIDNFAEPKFQFMLRDANITAAKSTRLEDLNILSELLACHIEKGNDIKIDAGISRAINIVNEVDLDSLCALTIVLSILNTKPVTGNVEEGLSVLNDLYTKLLTHPLPEDDAWIDNLNVVGAINILSGSFYKVDKLLSSRFDGYLSVGIKSDSNEHKKAIEILENNHYSKDVLKNNVFLPEYLRLPIVNNAELKPELKPILELYSKDKVLQQTINDNFMNKWDTYDALKIVKEWFNNIPVFFRINSVGKALAQTNAKRCYSGFPDLI